MPECPLCGTAINHLDMYEEAEVKYNLGCDTRGEPTFVQLDLIMGDGRQRAECPQCHEELFDHQDKAARWLAGLGEWVPIQPV